MDQYSIIEGCKQGKEKAFKALVDQYAPALLAVCIRYLKDHALAKDALQEGMISIFRSVHTYSGKGSFEGWMSKIVVNACLKEIRIQKHFQNLTIIDLHESREEDAYSSIATEDIGKLINKLPEVQRIVFNMFVVEGYSHAEIGELTGIPESSSRVYLTRARKWLQEKIESSDKEVETFIKYKN